MGRPNHDLIQRHSGDDVPQPDPLFGIQARGRLIQQQQLGLLEGCHQKGHCLPLTAGSCTLCRKCTYPERPCRFPKKRFSSMEAYGLLVSDVCLKSGLKYYYGPKTITYTSCILTD